MRVSSLSDERVIDLLTRYFVPVWLSRDHYQLDAPTRAEQEELLRIDRERRSRHLEGGTVCVYILAADGTLLATLPVQRAWKPEHLIPFLEKIVRAGRLTPRSPAAIRASTAPPRPPARARTTGGLVLGVWTRGVDLDLNRGVSADRVELAPTEWTAFMPRPDARPGDSWTVPQEVAHKLFRHCYPPGPHWDVKDCKVLSGILTAQLVTATAAEARIRLEGSLELSYPAGNKEADGRVRARLVGFVRCSPARRAITALALASEQAGYVWLWQGKPQPRKVLIAIELQP